MEKFKKSIRSFFLILIGFLIGLLFCISCHPKPGSVTKVEKVKEYIYVPKKEIVYVPKTEIVTKEVYIEKKSEPVVCSKEPAPAPTQSAPEVPLNLTSFEEGSGSFELKDHIIFATLNYETTGDVQTKTATPLVTNKRTFSPGIQFQKHVYRSSWMSIGADLKGSLNVGVGLNF